MHINYSLIINNFIILAYQLKYNLNLYPNFNLKGDIPVNLYFNVVYIKFITNNNSDQLSWK